MSRFGGPGGTRVCWATSSSCDSGVREGRS